MCVMGFFINKAFLLGMIPLVQGGDCQALLYRRLPCLL